MRSLVVVTSLLGPCTSLLYISTSAPRQHLFHRHTRFLVTAAVCSECRSCPPRSMHVATLHVAALHSATLYVATLHVATLHVATLHRWRLFRQYTRFLIARRKAVCALWHGLMRDMLHALDEDARDAEVAAWNSMSAAVKVRVSGCVCVCKLSNGVEAWSVRLPAQASGSPIILHPQ